MGSPRKLALSLLAFIGQTFIADASPLGSVNGVVSPLSILHGAASLEPHLPNTDFLRNLSHPIHGNHPSSLAVQGTALNLTLPSNDDDLICINPERNEYTCTDHANDAIVFVTRIEGGRIPRSVFDPFLNQVVNAVDVLIRLSGALGKETPRVLYSENEPSGLYFTITQIPLAARLLRLRHILAAARTIRAENRRAGGAVPVEYVIYDIVSDETPPPIAAGRLWRPERGVHDV